MGQVNSERFKLWKVNLKQIKLGQVRADQISSGHVRQVMSGQVKKVEVTSELVNLGQVKWKFTKFVETVGSNLFYFQLKDFSKKVFPLFSQMPDALGVYGTMCKVKKGENLF